MRLPRGLAPLRHRGFRLLASGQLASNVGDAFYAVALPWYVLASHGGPLLLATVLASYGVPRTVAVAVGGHASDRWRPWTVMMTADVVRAVTVAALGAAALAGPPRAAVLVPIAVVLGAGEGLFLPGSLSIIPALLPADELQAANALSFGGTELAALAGPAVGGAVVALAGAAPAFFVDAASFVISASTLAGIRATTRAPAVLGAPDGETEPAQTLWSVVRSERVLQVILLTVLAANLGSAGMSEVSLPALAHGPFRAGADGYGGLVAALGVGALVGTLAAGQTRRLRRPAIVASVAFLVAGAVVAAAPYLDGALPAGAALAVFGGLAAFGNLIVITPLQRWAPPELLGRLMGLVMLAGFGVAPVSVVLAGVVARTLGPAAFFPLTGAALVAALGLGLTQSSWRAFGAAPAGEVDPGDQATSGVTPRS